MRSMTGYSKLNYEDENYVISMEIKSVNNKNLTTKVKLPYNLNLLENYIRAEIASFISRGSIDFRIEFEDKNENLKSLKYDEDLAKSCMQILNKMEEDFNEKFSNKLDFLVRNFGVISQKDLDTDEEKYKEIISLKLRELLQDFIKTKVEEGNRLRSFFKEQLNILKSKVEEVKKLKPQVVENYRERLLANVNSVKADIDFKEEDILKEILLFSDRVDITEEVSRLESHFKQLEYEFNADKDSQGKKIEFIFQEIFREFNTMGVKSNMYEISKLVVEGKNELEKMREQIMNIE
ncbi:YicC family protein [Fusobacterium periodonticum]|jgi:TIGR00255 family protein|uniref:YicC family protein n=1 Tax=Fusobacterium pseudoperiodonticum TaxID=2663009 RepID=A0AAD0AJH5_9FUSO|nr:YicC/YloC family endoribonuclease [Fusobacterium pseudoperiodonticum]ATV36570.1 YicC family protein [Fusobacterium pseudoperiodonticum]ATV60524.1 YicC family protein [Fusobacterium pseudoperiodonticum]